MYGPGVVPLRRPAVRELVLGSAERRTNLALILLTVLAVVTGALNFAAGTGRGIVATVMHGAVGVGMLLLTRYKWRMVRQGMRLRRAASTWPSVVLGVTVVIAIVTGILHTSELVLDHGPLDDMQVHVGAGLLTIPFTVWHVFARGNLPARRDLDRGAGSSPWPSAPSATRTDRWRSGTVTRPGWWSPAGEASGG